VAMTALASLANPFGAALGQLFNPMFVTEAGQIQSMVLYDAIILTVLSIPAVFVPKAPPKPPCRSAAEHKLDWRPSLRLLVRNTEFYLLLLLFGIFVGFFNSFTTLLNQILLPYGFTNDQSGLAGAILIICGLVSAAIVSPIIDRTHLFVFCIVVQVPIICACYIAMLWAPASSNAVASVYGVCALLGASSFPLVGIALELSVERTHPVSPALTSSSLWSLAQLLGVISIVIMDALIYPADQGNPPGNVTRGIWYVIIVSCAAIPLTWLLAWFGRKSVNRRIKMDLEIDVAN